MSVSMPRIASTLAAALLACAIGTQAQPAAPPGPGQSMLVLDASGSMWGQIGGKPKIEIAREAVASMLQSWPASQELGLMAYGHRSKGNCADIEMLKVPGALDKTSFQQAVNGLQPKGMTPISASVRMAAEQLKFSERKATVILVSDGEETCHADPCALGKELEKLGVDFTAHVVGFDIEKNPQAKAQLQCLASSTGGRYLDAKNMGELADALQSVAKAPPAPKVNVTDGSDWIPDTQLWWEAGTEIEGGAHERDHELGSTNFTRNQTARDCQALCTQHPACGAWTFEPAGSYFIDHPRCALKNKGGALRTEKMEPGEGWVSGIKSGVKVMLQRQ